MSENKWNKQDNSSRVIVISENDDADQIASPKLEVIDSELGEELQKLSIGSQQKEQVLKVVRTFFRRHELEFHSGPLPSPSNFRSYEETCPGAATRILSMAECEQEHRHSWEKEQIAFDRRYAMTGLWMGWFIASALIAGAVYVGLQGHDIVAGALVAASAVGMVAKFIHGKPSLPQLQESEQKEVVKVSKQPNKPSRRRR